MPKNWRKDSAQLHDLADVEGWLSLEEAELLYRLARAAPLPTVVEIGSWKGRSTIVLARALQSRRGGIVHAIDPHTGSREHGTAVDTYAEFVGNLSRKGVAACVQIHRARSLQVAERWSEPVGMLWVDGSHDYEDVRADIECWSKFVVPGGFVAVHDTTAWPGPARAVDETIIRGRYFVNHGLAGSILFAQVQAMPRSARQGLRPRAIRAVRLCLSLGIRLKPVLPTWAQGAAEGFARSLRGATHPAVSGRR